MAERTMTGRAGSAAAFADRLMLGLSRHWLLVAGLALGLWVLLPWLAPLLMVTGLEDGARLIYALYSVQCHQLPQRSYFLFGPRLMVSLTDVNAVWPYTDYLRLRQFTGAPEIGYKVAWSDRMVSFYTPLFIGALAFALARWRSAGQEPWRPLRIRWWLVALVPLAIDGLSHLVNDATGLGFRDTNDWLAWLSGGAFATTFYAGDAIGSFNWWMRLLTGLLAGVATVWLIYPHLAEGFAGIQETLEAKTNSAERQS